MSVKVSLRAGDSNDAQERTRVSRELAANISHTKRAWFGGIGCALVRVSRMRAFRKILFAIVAAALCGCGGGSGPSSLLPTGSADSSSSVATQRYILTGTAQTLPLPGLSGCDGHVTLPALGLGAQGTSLTLTSSLTAPAGVSLSAARRPASTGRLDVLCYVSFSVSKTVALPSVPGFSVTAAPAINTAPPEQFYYALTQPPTAGATLSFRTEGPATVSGQTLTFDASPNPLTLVTGQTYVFGFYGLAPASIASATRLYVADVDGNRVAVFDLAHGTPHCRVLPATEYIRPRA